MGRLIREGMKVLNSPARVNTIVSTSLVTMGALGLNSAASYQGEAVK